MKLVLIKEEGRFFPFYKEWAYGISPKHADLYVMGSRPQKNRVYIAIISGYYFRNTNIPLTLIQDPITRQVYTIETNQLIDLTKMLEVEPQNSTTADITSMTIHEVLNILERRIIQVDEELTRQEYGSQMIYRAIEINLLERTVDLFADKFNLTDTILYTPEDVQNLINTITDEADKLAENLFDTMDLMEIESPIMEFFNER